MKITIQNTLLSGQRVGRTIQAQDDKGAEVLAANVAVQPGGGEVTLTVEHSVPKWPEGLAASVTAATEELAAEQLVAALVEAAPKP